MTYTYQCQTYIYQCNICDSIILEHNNKVYYPYHPNKINTFYVNSIEYLFLLKKKNRFNLMDLL